MALIAVAVGSAVLAAIITWVVATRRLTGTADAPAEAGADDDEVVDSPAPPRTDDVLDRLRLGVVVVDATGRVRLRNRAAGASDGTHVGLLVDDAVETLLRRALAGEEASRTLELYGPPGMAMVVSVAPLDDGGAVATIEDISERRRVDAVRTDFVANISHELKTPVGALAVLAEALADEDDPAVVQRVAARIVDEAHRVARTIDDLLELAGIELGAEPTADLVDLADVVSAAVDRARPSAVARDIDVTVLDPHAGGRVPGDRRQLVSALGNMVENAVKYSEPGGRVQVGVRMEGAWAELMVVDHGIGIPAADHDRIFERFYRVDRARSRDTGGTGLGLSIVRHVATNHGGDVLVSSREGEGSTFVLRIPTRAGGDDEAGTVATVEPGPGWSG